MSATSLRVAPSG